jgi:hypothetical protein
LYLNSGHVTLKGIGDVSHLPEQWQLNPDKVRRR